MTLAFDCNIQFSSDTEKFTVKKKKKEKETVIVIVISLFWLGF